MIKSSYFNGTEEPTPKKKQYKSEPAIIDQSRFKEPFYKNYDLYDVDGEHGPGAGWNSMHKYKSIKDFLAAKKKQLKEKYKADPMYKMDDGTISRKAREFVLAAIIKNAIDFPIDDQVYSPILGKNDSSYENSVEIGGLLGDTANDIIIDEANPNSADTVIEEYFAELNR